jgi:hypothetical protein
MASLPKKQLRQPAAASLLNRKNRRLATPHQEPVDEENQNGAERGRNEAAGLALAVPADRIADEAGKERSGYAEQDGNDAAARIASRHDQFGKYAGNGPDDDPPEKAVRSQHFTSLLQTSPKTEQKLRPVNLNFKPPTIGKSSRMLYGRDGGAGGDLAKYAT